jgi:methyl-accepting chemotaxis protein
MLSVVQQTTDILSVQGDTLLNCGEGQNHGKGDWGSARLDVLIDGLADVDRVTEQSFLALGSQIQGFHGRAHGISQVAGDVLALLQGETGENTLQRLQLLVERCSLWLSDTDKKSIEICTLLKGVLELINDLELPVAGLRKVIKTLHSLRVSTRIEAAKGYASEATVLAKSLDELCRLVQEKVVEIFDRTEEIVPVINRSIAMEESVQTDSIRMASQDVDKARILINTFLETCIETGHWTDRLKDRSDDVTQNFGEMIAALQFQDITKQRVEHVQKALDSLSLQLEKFTHQQDFGNNAEASRLFGHICRLQHDQLIIAVQEFVTATDNLSENLQGMATSVVCMAEDTRELVRATDGGCDNRFTAVLDILQSIAGYLEKTSSTHELAGRNLNEVNAGIQQVSDLVSEIEYIGEEMQLLAINAAICAAHAHLQGAGLDVIAQNIQTVAEEACRHALTLAKKCETITEHARNLQNVEQKTNASADNVGDLLQEAQKRMANLDVSCLQLADLAGKVDRDAAGLSEEVSSIVHTIDIGEIFQGELAPVLEQLSTLSRCVGEETSDFDNTSLDILFNELELCYTMASERKLHQSFLDSQRLPTPGDPPAPGDLSTPSDLTEEDDWDKNRQHDLGDNIDLF